MSMPFFIPTINYAKSLPAKGGTSIIELCRKLGIKCRASGDWVNRKIIIKNNSDLSITAEPGDWGAVLIEAKIRDPIEQAKLALYILAYGLHDLVAKESIKGLSWTKPLPPTGRPKKMRALSNKERQKRYRDRQKKMGRER